VKEVILEHQPDFIFHLAAQPLVLDSYQRPLYTFEVNTQGTAHVLDALRFLEKPCIAIMITTDKVYENKDLGTCFKEEDKLGGYDPYSASKAACEIVIQSYTYSFFHKKKEAEHKKKIVSVRAGNVIGGGDYAANRIIPDIISAVQKNETVILRNPTAIRPWQHVLEPVVAYLNIAYEMVVHPVRVGEAYNIGPEKEDALTVQTLTEIALKSIGQGQYEVREDINKPHEAGILMLDIQKLKQELNWHPVYSATKAIEKTVEWYMSDENAQTKCLKQIQEYFESFR
jgi:CDP-glucose 4,6-dehydratase